MSTNGLDGGPRGTSGSEIMSALGSSRKQRIFFFTGDDKEIGSHAVKDIMGDAQSVDSVVAWSQCREMLLTSADKRQSVLVMDTERGVTKSELSLRRERKNWNMTVDSIAPMQKWEQYNRSDEIHLYGLGDNGRTVFHLHHDSRIRDNVEEHVIAADSCRKYKSYIFTSQAQTKAGFLALGRSDGAIALYDYVMKSENASCVLDGQPGPVNAVDVSADGRWLVWTTPDFVFFTVLEQTHWSKGKKEKPRIMRLDISDADQAKFGLAAVNLSAEEEEDDLTVNWLPARFDAGTADLMAADTVEREIISYVKDVQVRWPLKQLLKAYDAEEATYFGLAKSVTDNGSVAFHRPVLGDVDLVALSGEIVKTLKF